MKVYSVFLKKDIQVKYIRERLNKNTQEWEEFEIIKNQSSFDFYSLSKAKKFIKENIDNYLNSTITKVYSNGDWENCGEISLNINNKKFVANTRQTKKSY